MRLYKGQVLCLLLYGSPFVVVTLLQDSSKKYWKLPLNPILLRKVF